MKISLIKAVASAVGLTVGLMASGAVLAADQSKLAEKSGCLACHNVDKKVLGPAYKDVAKKYKANKDAAVAIAKKIKEGSTGVWGPIPMPPNAKVSDADIKALAEWVMSM